LSDARWAAVAADVETLGVGGVIRDIIAVSARPIANADVLCFVPRALRRDRRHRGLRQQDGHSCDKRRDGV
jgi:hypothetical protein